MSAIDLLFSKLRAAGKKALMPFVTAGDPDIAFTLELLRACEQEGAALAELGIPYSDPIADGPVIQASYTRALSSGVTVAGVLSRLAQIQPKLAMPVVTMVSYAIVLRHGLSRYIEQAQAAGVSGAIVPDLLLEEAGELAQLCRKADFSLIQLVTPATPRDRALQIAELSSGFLYYVSVAGITGERTKLPPQLVDNVGWLRERTPLPICIGFGVSQPEHVRLLGPVSDGLIVGSAIVRRVAECGQKSRAEVLADVRQFIGSLVQALPGAGR